MKESKEDKMLKELFRHKLENAEVVPSQAAGKNLMSRLGRKEFLRFNPGRFNIWYAGAIAVAGTALALILTLDNGKTNNSLHVNEPESKVIEIINDQDINNSQLNIQNEDDITRRATISEKKISGKSSIINKNASRQNNRIQKNGISVPTEIVSSLPKEGMFQDKESKRNRLQGETKISGSFIESNISEGCTPLKVRFKNKDVICDSCRWTFGDGGYSTEKDTEWLFDVPGEYNVTLQVFGPNGQISTSSEMITVHYRPVARFEIAIEDAILPDDEMVFHNFSTDAIRFSWDFGDGNNSELFEPRHQYRKYGSYSVTLVAISESGCSDSITVTNAFSGKGFFIDFPNAFIPNPNGPSNGYYSYKSDESAQVFHPVFTGVSQYQLRIFSRRGILLFESNDINIGWDGYYKGQLSEPGVYIWKVRGNFVNGEPFTKMGDVTLLKN